TWIGGEFATIDTDTSNSGSYPFENGDTGVVTVGRMAGFDSYHKVWRYLGFRNSADAEQIVGVTQTNAGPGELSGAGVHALSAHGGRLLAGGNFNALLAKDGTIYPGYRNLV